MGRASESDIPVHVVAKTTRQYADSATILQTYSAVVPEKSVPVRYVVSCQFQTGVVLSGCQRFATQM